VNSSLANKDFHVLYVNSDEQMQELKEVIQNGWPNRKYDVPPSAMIYFDVRDELTVQNGLIFKGERVVIPTSLRLDMIKRIHGRLGIS
jgi:hypothetical protein